MQYRYSSHLILLSLASILASCGGGDSSEKTDSIPDQITFAHQTDVAPNETIKFGPVELTGFNTPVTISKGSIESRSTVDSALTNEMLGNSAYYVFSVDGKQIYDDSFEVTAGQSLEITLYAQGANDVITEGSVFVGDMEVPFGITTTSYTGPSMLISSADRVSLYRYTYGSDFRSKYSDDIVTSTEDTNVAIHTLAPFSKGNIVYALSSNTCNLDTPYQCLGNSTIQMFSYDANFVSFEGIAFDAKPNIAVDSYFTAYGSIIITFTNNFATPLSIDSTYIFSDAPDITGASACTDKILAAESECSVALNISDTPEFTGGRVEISTSEGTFSTLIYGSDSEYSTTGIFAEAEMENTPLCQYQIAALSEQSGACHFQDLVFSSDGSYAFASEAYNNSIVSFQVTDDGTLAFISEFVKTGDNRPSLAISANGSIIYSGDTAYTHDNGVLSLVHTGQHSYDTELTSSGTLVTTMDFDGVAIFDVNNDPLSPVLIGATDTSGSSFHTDLTMTDEMVYSTGSGGEGIEVRAYRFPAVTLDEETYLQPEQTWSIDMLNGCSECNNTFQLTSGIAVDESTDSIFLTGRIDNLTGSETGTVSSNGRIIRIALTGKEEKTAVAFPDPVTDLLLLP